MPRRPRGVLINTLLHVTARSTRGQLLFTCERDFRTFLDQLRACLPQHGAQVHAYCLMSTHLHLILQVGDVPASRVLQTVLQRYAQYVNRRYGSRGHVFGTRFWSGLCQMDSYFLELLQYIHLNPVRAGIVPHPDLYPWSSHHAYMRPGHRSWVTTEGLNLFGGSLDRAVEGYAAFIGTHLDMRRSLSAAT